MTRPSSIVSAPYPLSDESPASWILRVCKLHEISYKSLTKALALTPCRDPDITADRANIWRVGVGTCVSPTRLLQLADSFDAVRSDPFLKRLLTYDGKDVPSYSFCPDCLSSDPVPYLRIGWRLSCWTVCPDHLTLLSNRCANCDSPQYAVTSASGMGSRKIGCVSLCQACGAPLSAHANMAPESSSINGAHLRFQHAIVSAIRTGKTFARDVRVPLPLRFLLWLKDNHTEIEIFRDRWIASIWPNRKQAYITAELERRIAAAYEERRSAEGEGRVTIDSYLAFCRLQLTENFEMRKSCKSYVESHRHSYYMSLLIEAYSATGGRRIAFMELVQRSKRRRNSTRSLLSLTACA